MGAFEARSWSFYYNSGKRFSVHRRDLYNAAANMFSYEVMFITFLCFPKIVQYYLNV